MLAAVCIYHRTTVINFLEPAKVFAGRPQDNASVVLQTKREVRGERQHEFACIMLDAKPKTVLCFQEN